MTTPVLETEMLDGGGFRGSVILSIGRNPWGQLNTCREGVGRTTGIIHIGINGSSNARFEIPDMPTGQGSPTKGLILQHLVEAGRGIVINTINGGIEITTCIGCLIN